MRNREVEAIHQLQQLLDERVFCRGLMDSFYLFLNKQATAEDIERLARYLNEQHELIPSTHCLKKHYEELISQFWWNELKLLCLIRQMKRDHINE